MLIALHYDIATVAPLKSCWAKKIGDGGGDKITVINWRSRVNFGISYREVWEFDIHLNSHLCMLFVFSLQFQSHQIFHVLVVAAAFVHLYGICQMAYYRFHHGTACENWTQGLINPWSPNSDQDQFSPNNIHMLPREMVMRVNKMIT